MSRYRPAPELWTRAAIPVVRSIAAVTSRPDYRHRTGLPLDGGVILATNHLSHLDPVLLARFAIELGRIPRFLAKHSLFDVPVFGTLLRGARQIPVYRNQERATDALTAAVAALRAGELVVIYPEGTITTDPDRWPMLARTGVARLALAAEVPVIPVAHWGAQFVAGPGLRFRPRRHFAVSAGPALDLPAMSAGMSAAMPEGPRLRALTDAVMSRIRDQLGELRDDTPPALVWDPRSGHRATSAAA